MHNFGKLLRKAYTKYGRAPAYLFKSDCLEAFCRIPMHVLWQIRQVVTIDGQCHVDRCLVFGNWGAPNIWCSFMALVVWIAINIKHIEDLLHYMDDAFGYEMDPVLEYYVPYDKHYPKKQVVLLHLWDELNLPHNIKKQEFGSSLVIISFHVDPACMTLSISLSAREEPGTAIEKFLDMSKSHRRSLHQWQHLLGWVNWALNIFPLLRPALQSCYAKITGKSFRNAGIFLNKAVIRDLTWFTERIKSTHGLHFFEDEEWDYIQGNLIIFCGASTVGLGFYIPAKALGFTSNIPPNPLVPNILFYETLTVTSTVAWAAALQFPPCRLLIYTDSLDIVEMFHSLCAQEGYNELLLFMVELLMSKRISLRVCRVAGTNNSIADAISCSPNGNLGPLSDCSVNVQLLLVTPWKNHNFPIQPTIDMLSFYVVYMCHHIKPSTVGTYLSGICHLLEPYYPDVRKACSSQMVCRLLAGMKKLSGLQPTNCKRALTHEDLCFIISSLTVNPSYNDCLFIAMLLTSFFGLLQLGEITFPDNPCKCSFKKVIMSHTLSVVPMCLAFTLPYHKADQFYTGNTVIIEALPHSPINPLSHMQAYLALQDATFPLLPSL
ncbi:hypothetical protein M422DRAFT_182388 [Sphaerobolus stellatus SS14]|uniref:Uncharacterized protein n=1 Tax=Sphaerobolus stellatus (strain SS14) TaxID=990650 RepID=A0A0C9VA66_SPHS4|nr:hypothetical protein M422DRAFT_182388 [Sphaerobolus stellatus SS14]